MRNLILTMVLGGLWHGASWNFVFWGAFHGALLIVYRVTPLSRLPETTGTRRIGAIALMFTFTTAGSIFFRSNSLEQALHIFGHLSLSRSVHSMRNAAILAGLLGPLLLVEFIQERASDLLILLRTPPSESGRVPRDRRLPRVVCRPRRTEFIYFRF